MAEAKNYCKSMGEGYHLITDAEWMTIAENIAGLPINDLSDGAGLQLANGLSGSPTPSGGVGLPSDPNISGCDLYQSLGSEVNLFSEVCQLGYLVNATSTEEAFGYVDTGAHFGMSYNPTTNSRASLRTAVLSNRQIIWDIAGNVAEWVDNMSIASEHPTSEEEISGWYEYNSISKYASMSSNRPSVYGMSSANGIGMLYSAVEDGNATKASIRGGSFMDGERAGVFSLDLSKEPDYAGEEVGFRCAK